MWNIRERGKNKIIKNQSKVKNIDQCRGVFHWASQRHLHFAPVSFSHTYTPTHSVRGDKTRAKIPQKHTVHTVHTHTLRGDLPANEQKPKKNPKKFKGKMNINSKTFIGLFEIKKEEEMAGGKREREREKKKATLRQANCNCIRRWESTAKRKWIDPMADSNQTSPSQNRIEQWWKRKFISGLLLLLMADSISCAVFIELFSSPLANSLLAVFLFFFSFFLFGCIFPQNEIIISKKLDWSS